MVVNLSNTCETSVCTPPLREFLLGNHHDTCIRVQPFKEGSSAVPWWFYTEVHPLFMQAMELIRDHSINIIAIVGRMLVGFMINCVWSIIRSL